MASRLPSSHPWRHPRGARVSAGSGARCSSRATSSRRRVSAGMPRRIREAGPGAALLDTHVWVWYEEGAEARLPRAALAVLRRHVQAGQLYVSPLSAWEVAMLVAKRRLRLSLDVPSWVARALGATLVTRDREILAYGATGHVVVLDAAA